MIDYLCDDKENKSSCPSAEGGSQTWSFRRQTLIWPTQDLVLHTWNLSGVLGSSFVRSSL